MRSVILHKTVGTFLTVLALQHFLIIKKTGIVLKNFLVRNTCKLDPQRQESIVLLNDRFELSGLAVIPGLATVVDEREHLVGCFMLLDLLRVF